MLMLLPIGNVYIGDFGNHRIRKITVSTGVITTIAGTGTASFSGDGGLATSAELNSPAGVILDASGIGTNTSLRQPSLIVFVGNVYICDEYNHRVRKITVSTGIISTIAGVGTSSTSIGDGGPAASARLSYPGGIVLDSSGITAYRSRISARIICSY